MCYPEHLDVLTGLPKTALVKVRYFLSTMCWEYSNEQKKINIFLECQVVVCVVAKKAMQEDEKILVRWRLWSYKE